MDPFNTNLVYFPNFVDPGLPKMVAYDNICKKLIFLF